MSAPAPSSSQRAGESLALGLLAASFGAAILVDSIGAVASLIWNGDWAWVSLGAMPEVLGALPGNIGDPRRAWPAHARETLPGPLPLYMTTAVALVASAFAAVTLSRSTRRHARPPAAKWATRRDLRVLEHDGRQPGRLTLGRARGRILATEARQSVLVVAPTQSGKTTALAIPAILDWQGPVVATSIKSDLVLDTRGHRATCGEVHIFDPTGSTGLKGLASWSPLAACRSWQGARRTAAWLTDAASPNRRGMTDGDFWYATAAKLLAPLLFAAARSGCTMEQVVTWLDRQEESEVLKALEVAGCHAAITAMEATWARDSRQKSSVYTTAETVIEAYADPGVLANSMRFDIDASELLDGGNDTVYLCATARDQKRLRPVFVTLIQEILEEAYARSARSGKPLEPPLLIVLDEAANVAPLPDLDVIAATGAGQGVHW